MEEADLAQQRLMMLNMDPPMHTRYRRLVNKGFTPRMVGDLETHIREMTGQIVDEVAAKGECDFVTDVAAELPLQVIAELMGVPQEDRHLMFDWSNRMIGAEDPEYGVLPEEATPGRHGAVRLRPPAGRAEAGATRTTTSSACCSRPRSTASA